MGQVKSNWPAMRKMQRTNPDPKNYGVAFRKGEPILVARGILRWRKWRRKEAVKARKLAAKKAKYSQMATETHSRLEGLIINPFKAED